MQCHALYPPSEAKVEVYEATNEPRKLEGNIFRARTHDKGGFYARPAGISFMIDNMQLQHSMACLIVDSDFNSNSTHPCTDVRRIRKTEPGWIHIQHTSFRRDAAELPDASAMHDQRCRWGAQP